MNLSNNIFTKAMKSVLIILSSVTIIGAFLILRPVPITSESEAMKVAGVVLDIYKTEGNDIVFVLEDDERTFYINRGFKNQLELDNLKGQLIGNSIVIKYPDYWTPLDWNNQIKHISKVEFKNKIVFNEFIK